MIDIFARWVDGKLVCEPKKRRGMTKGEYLRAVYACEQMNKQDEKNPTGQNPIGLRVTVQERLVPVPDNEIVCILKSSTKCQACF